MLFLAAGLQWPVFADDMETVKQILEKCGITAVDPASVVIVEEGAVVSLDLNNKEITNDGISFLPPEIGMLSNLRVLSCSGNIIDSLPAEIGNLSNLKKLDCSSNRITMLPATIGNLTKLTHLDMRHNRLAVLPPEIGNCSSLELLQLWGNKLTGIDEAVVRLPALKELYLKDNRLTALPKSIVKLDLGYLDVMGNKLCDPPAEVDKWIRKRDARYRELQKCW
jgi:Leucine-rich repeat (LRR) protein